MSEEFCTVTRKKWLARKSLERRPRRISDKGYDNDCPDVDVDKFLIRLEQLREKMSCSDYYTQAMATLKQCQTELPACSAQPQRLVCFGLGPFTRNYQALHQLAFIMELQRQLQITEAFYFDPIFRDSEKTVLERLQCTLLRENCEAKYLADVPTLFYLPHCPNCLTNNLLWRNWQPELLQNVLLVNNSFDSLTSSKPKRLLRLDSQYILDVLPYVCEFALEDDYKTHNVFNDLAVHAFPTSKMPAADDTEFWAEREAPVYVDADVEMVTTADFNKLSIE